LVHLGEGTGAAARQLPERPLVKWSENRVGTDRLSLLRLKKRRRASTQRMTTSTPFSLFDLSLAPAPWDDSTVTP